MASALTGLFGFIVILLTITITLIQALLELSYSYIERRLTITPRSASSASSSAPSSHLSSPINIRRFNLSIRTMARCRVHPLCQSMARHKRRSYGPSACTHGMARCSGQNSYAQCSSPRPPRSPPLTIQSRAASSAGGSIARGAFAMPLSSTFWTATSTSSCSTPPSCRNPPSPRGTSQNHQPHHASLQSSCLSSTLTRATPNTAIQRVRGACLRPSPRSTPTCGIPQSRVTSALYSAHLVCV